MQKTLPDTVPTKLVIQIMLRERTHFINCLRGVKECPTDRRDELLDEYIRNAERGIAGQLLEDALG